MTEVFTFRNPSNTTTSGQVETYKVYKGSNLSNDNLIASYIYTYDNNGNILTTFDGTNETRYTYDNVNQLIREDNQSKGESYVWTYDNSGNILSFGIYPYTIGDLDATGTNPIVYSYGNSMWKDLLTGLDERIITYEYEDPEISLNEDGECITLNNIGNPLFIGDPKNDNDPGNRSFTWAHGRQLQTLSQNEITWEFTYSSNGQRTGRYIKNGGSSYEYVYNDSKLMQMTVINNEETNIVNFTYDVKGLPLTMIVDGSIYYYITNLQGDVVALVDAIGTTVASYSYTAYGEVFTEGNPTIIGLNPLTYRGYIYDIETNLYYLQSRYYDPVIGRFLNSDGIIATGQGLIGNNMFSYCMNNPVGRYDSEGDASGPITDKIIHDVVLAYLCATNKDLSMTQTCVYYNGVDAWGGWGFCDLYNTTTGEVWELKKDSWTYSCTTKRAEKQLDNYIGGRLKHKPSLTLKRPSTTIISGGSFDMVMNGYVYHISYWNEGNGILRYSYTYEKTEARKAAEMVLIVAGACCLIIFAPEAAPVVAPAILMA